jgi:hypothetical protein
MANSFTTPEPSININLDQDLLADAEEGSISFWEQDLALWTSCVANLKAYNEKKRLREEAEDEEDSSFDYRSIYFYLPEDHATGIPNAEERLQWKEIYAMSKEDLALNKKDI